MSDALVHSITAMGTVISLHVVGGGVTQQERRLRSAAVERASQWFHFIENECSRFNPASTLRQLTHRVGEPLHLDPLLFELIRFSITVAEESGGAFDPTVGYHLETLGFTKEWRSGREAPSGLATETAISFRDVVVDSQRRTVFLKRPIIFDLGGVAKGLAIDLAARALGDYANVAIDAGGDLYLRGHNAEGSAWSVGIRHPREPGEMLATLALTDIAICTSGDYERPAPTDSEQHHLVDPRAGGSAQKLISATVLAPTAMVADALATAAFVLGPRPGLELLTRHGVEGLLVTPTLTRLTTAGMPSV